MGARLLIGTQWFGRRPEDELARLEILLGRRDYELQVLAAQHAELQAGMGALRAVAGAIVLRLGGEARLHRSDISMAMQVMEQSGGFVMSDEADGIVTVRVGKPSRIIVPGARMPRG